jgi:hypothetical protein
MTQDLGDRAPHTLALIARSASLSRPGTGYE